MWGAMPLLDARCRPALRGRLIGACLTSHQPTRSNPSPALCVTRIPPTRRCHCDRLAASWQDAARHPDRRSDFSRRLLSTGEGSIGAFRAGDGAVGLVWQGWRGRPACIFTMVGLSPALWVHAVSSGVELVAPGSAGREDRRRARAWFGVRDAGEEVDRHRADALHPHPAPLLTAGVAAHQRHRVEGQHREPQPGGVRPEGILPAARSVEHRVPLLAMGRGHRLACVHCRQPVRFLHRQGIGSGAVGHVGPDRAGGPAVSGREFSLTRAERPGKGAPGRRGADHVVRQRAATLRRDVGKLGAFALRPVRPWCTALCLDRLRHRLPGVVGKPRRRSARWSRTAVSPRCGRRGRCRRGCSADGPPRRCAA